MLVSAKPDGANAQAVPASKTYRATPAALRQTVLAVLTDQGYLYEEVAGGIIKTEPKVLGDPSKFAFFGASYSAKLQIRLEGSTVTYRARFDKKSNVTMSEPNMEYPEKENELRGSLLRRAGQAVAEVAERFGLRTVRRLVVPMASC